MSGVVERVRSNDVVRTSDVVPAAWVDGRGDSIIDIDDTVGWQWPRGVQRAAGARRHGVAAEHGHGRTRQGDRGRPVIDAAVVRSGSARHQVEGGVIRGRGLVRLFDCTWWIRRVDT